MSTGLSRTTSTVRRLIVFLVIAAVALWILQSTTHFLDPYITPTPSVRPSGNVTTSNCETPKKTFDKIPKLKLTSLTLAPGTSATFSTDTSKFPTFPTSLTVYKLDKMHEELGDADRARATALDLGLNLTPEISGSTTLQWQNTDETKRLIFDKSAHTWDLTTNLNNTSLSLLNSSISTYTQFNTIILNAVRLTKPNYSNYEVDYRYILRKFDRTLQSTYQINKANILNIDFFKTVVASTCKDAQQRPVVSTARVISPDYKDQSYNVQITGKGQNLKTDVLSVKVREFDISTITGIYPTITYDEAWGLLQENHGILYWILPEGGDIYSAYQQLKIVKFQFVVADTKIVYLEPQKYIDSDTSTQYIEPYYEFSGKGITDTNQNVDVIFLIPALQSNSYL